jgi:hypothetical protein
VQPSMAHLRRRDPKDLKALNNFPRLGRLVIVNHFRRAVAALTPITTFPALMAFLPQNLWPWIRDYLKYAFTKWRTPILALNTAAEGAASFRWKRRRSLHVVSGQVNYNR